MRTEKGIFFIRQDFKFEKFPFESIGYESLAISYLEMGQYINAIEILNNAIKIFPEEYYFYYYLGLCYKNNSKNTEAINYFLKALKINPQLKNVMHELAKLYNLESDYETSDSLFTLLLENNIVLLFAIKSEVLRKNASS